MLKLIIEDDEGRKTVVPFVRDEITIGRQEGNTIRLTERNVSRRHARLLRQNGHILIEDLGSYNGIRVNGDRISGQVTVNDGDLIQIGDYDLAIQREEEQRANMATMPLGEATQPAHRSGPTRKMGAEAIAAATVPALPVVEPPQAADEDVEEAASDEEQTPAPGERNIQSTSVIRVDQVAATRPQRQLLSLDASEAPRLVVLNTEFAGREFPCSKTEVRVGRTDDNDVAIDHRSLSRTHCKVVREDNGEWRVIDLQSANGIMVNGEPYAQVTVRSGDVIELGHVKLKFLAAGETFNLGAASSAVTAETPPVPGPPPSSKTPVIAVVVALLVVILGGGGYFVLKGSGGGKIGNTGGGTAGTGGGSAVVVVPDLEAARRAADALVTQARTDIVSMKWSDAETKLKGCRIAQSPCPEAVALLTKMEGEQGLKTAIENAEAALNADNLDKANDNLQSARATELLKDKYQALEARREAMVKAKLDAKKGADEAAKEAAKEAARLAKEAKEEAARKAAEDKKAAEERRLAEEAAKKAAAEAAKKNAATGEAQKAYAEAQDLMKQKQFQAAANRLDKCIKADPKLADCYRLRGTAAGFLQEQQTVVKYYRLYLEVAPADDPMVAKVRERLAVYEKALQQENNGKQ